MTTPPNEEGTNGTEQNAGAGAGSAPSLGGMNFEDDKAGDPPADGTNGTEQNAGGEAEKNKEDPPAEAGNAKPYEIDYKGEKLTVPEQFRDESGAPNVGAMLRSLDDARRKLGTGEFNDPVPDDGEAYDFTPGEELTEVLGEFNADAPELKAIDEKFRQLGIGGKLGKELIGLYYELEGGKISAEKETAEEAIANYEREQIESVASVASSDDLKAFGGAALNLFKQAKGHEKGLGFDPSDPKKSAAMEPIVMQGLKEIDGSASAVVAMRFLMNSVSKGTAFKGIKSGGSDSAADPAARIKELQGSDKYWDNDPATLKEIETLMAQLGDE